eukprot:jgi/Orpsp1_1/1190479/evm.model.d7180000079288.1
MNTKIVMLNVVMFQKANLKTVVKSTNLKSVKNTLKIQSSMFQLVLKLLNNKKTTTIKKTRTVKKTTTTSNKIPTSTVEGRCGQNFGACAMKGYCCSKFGYCGKSETYCGTGCQPKY